MTPPYSPQSNGVAERKNRILTEMVNAMLDTAGLSKEWWGEAILTACHVLNRIPTKHKEVTPFEEWERKKLNLSHLRTWGCLTKVNVPIAKKRKLGPKTVDCVFLGYAIHSVGYRFLIVNSGVPDMCVGTITESRDATFFENEFPMKNAPSTSSQEPILSPEHFVPIEHIDQTLEENPEEDNYIVRDKGLQSLLEMTTLYILWMILQEPLKRHIHLLMLTIGRKRYSVDGLNYV
jgi:hypothetical protein